MSVPTITIGGTSLGLFIVTDHEGVVYRVPIASYPVVEFTNGTRNRIQIRSQHQVIVLLFDDLADLTTALAVIDGQY